ncbi:MAG: hypothetical protein NT038_08785 [Euryarchaeota archaeon]|nr:hypothetical protein [Euryarchaeota archaeon]
MNPFLNPIIGVPFIKKLIFDAERLKKMTPERMKKHKDNAIKRIVKYAYTVPLYHEKYKEAGVHPSDINRIEDVTKLPFITKQDIVKHFPNKIVPKNYNFNKGYVVSTSGSTGKPVYMYTDFQTMADSIGTSIRVFRTFNLHWRTSKFAYVMNYHPNAPPDAIEKVFTNKARSILPLKNHLSIPAFNPILNIMKKLDSFNPDLIVSLPATFQHLAFLKRKGFGQNLNPKILISGGYYLDKYTQSYVENSFGCKMFNIYASCEANADIAFECKERTWHINQDYFHVETIDHNKDIVDSGQRGHIVITRLFGKGTPIIRYTGMDDWVRISPDNKCKCGICSPKLITGVEGRISSSIILPDGRLFTPGTFSIISIVLSQLKTYKVKQFQIIQKSIDDIDILLEIDDELRDIDPSVKLIIDRIKEAYEKMVGPQVQINVKEVDEIKSNSEKPSPIVISHVSLEKIKTIITSQKSSSYDY